MKRVPDQAFANAIVRTSYMYKGDHFIGLRTLDNRLETVVLVRHLYSTEQWQQ